MKFQILDIVPYRVNPITGRVVSPADRFEQTLLTARRAEQLGFDAFAVGERHAGHFLSSSPTVLLGALAATTSRIRLNTGVTVLSILDPVRAAEDYATVDQLSRGRLEITIGKGNEVQQYPLFGLEIDDQWDLLADKYALLRELWRTEGLTWPGTEHTRAITQPTTTLPRPYAGAPRVWHGSATTLTSAALAGRWGDPLISANAIQPLKAYTVLVQHYRDEYLRHGHDPGLRTWGLARGHCSWPTPRSRPKNSMGRFMRRWLPRVMCQATTRHSATSIMPWPKGRLSWAAHSRSSTRSGAFTRHSITTSSRCRCPPRCRSSNSSTRWNASPQTWCLRCVRRFPPRCGGLMTRTVLGRHSRVRRLRRMLGPSPSPPPSRAMPTPMPFRIR